MHDWFPEKPILRDRLFYFPLAERRPPCRAQPAARRSMIESRPVLPQARGGSFALAEGAAGVLCYTPAIRAGLFLRSNG